MTKKVPKELSQLKTVGAITPHVEIADVRLVRLDCRLTPSWPEGGASKIRLDLAHTSRCEQRGECLAAEVRFSLTGVSTDDASKKIVILNAAFELVYNINREVALTKQQLSAFAQVNVLYNAWPYWRELVQDMAARMGLPRLVVPVFRVARPTPDSAPVQKDRPSD